jgi:hypothetical protein
MGYQRPCDGPISGGNEDPRVGTYRAHREGIGRHRSPEAGVDYTCVQGTPLHAPADGVVHEFKDTNTGATGRFLTLDLDDGRRVRWLHLKPQQFPAPGTRFRRGQVLAHSGGSAHDSDNGVAPHVHVTLWPGHFYEFGVGANTLDFEAHMDGGGGPAAAVGTQRQEQQEQPHQDEQPPKRQQRRYELQPPGKQQEQQEQQQQEQQEQQQQDEQPQKRQKRRQRGRELPPRGKLPKPQQEQRGRRSTVPVTTSDGDGLLSGGSGTQQWEPRPATPAAAEDADTVETFLNATLNNADKPLQVARIYQLAVHFGELSTGDAEKIFVPFPKGDDTVDLEVRVVSSHFEVPPFPQMLRLKRDGTSIGRAVFEVTPLEKDPTDENDSRFWVLTVLVTVMGNHLQRLDLTYDIERGATEADVTSYTRGGLGGAKVLRERAATLQFRPMDWGYELIAPQSPDPQPHKILVTPLELDKFIGSIRSALLHSVQLDSVASGLKISIADNSSLLEELSLAGFRLYQLLFAGDNATDDLLGVGDWLRESIAKKDVAILQVVADGFPVPWPLLYPAERWDPFNISWDNFIGMQCVVEQLPLTNPTPQSPEPTIESVPDLVVRALFNDSIDERIPTKPLAEQRRYWAHTHTTLLASTKADDLIYGALATTANDKVLYLYCHATSPSKDPEASELIFGDKAISLQQLRDFAPRRDKLAGHPLVFINACESADLTPQFYGGFVPYFLGKGARGVIGTECKVPGLFASEWAKAFFDELFAGKALGEVVLVLRRRFLEEYNNPLGLLYGVHCDADTVVAPALSRES